MSLIQEALKRQQEDSGDAPPTVPPPPVQDTTPSSDAPPVPPPSAPPPVPSETPAVPPPVPPPLPDTPAEEGTDSEPGEGVDLSQAPSPVKDTKPWKTLAGISLIVVLLVGGLGYGIFYFFQQWKSGQNSTEESSSDTGQDADTTDGDTTDTAGTNGDEVPDIEPVQEDAVPDITEANDDPPDDDSGAIAEDVYWPELTLTGLLGKGQSGIALFGDQQVEVGDKLEGVRLVRVGDQGVLLEYKGKTRFLKTNQSTSD